MADDIPLIPAVADSLTLALVASSDAPILLLDGNLTVIAASESFARTFQVDPAAIGGRSMFTLGDGEWDVRQLRSLLRVTLSGAAAVDAYEMDLTRPGHGPRRLVITAHKLDYADTVNVRLMLAVSDVTDARLAERLKDDLLREKAILFQELQHRVANILQIIASVLMQGARKMPSAETKGYLYDAHNRVMSVAALQRQLATSQIGDVALRTYFTELCESIGASMIHDHSKLTLKVEADEGLATAETSVSLGLIVTELVINALKHAFKEDGAGVIVVSYRSDHADWTLSVSDNGAGMLSTGPIPAKPEAWAPASSKALARRLQAKVSVAGNHPGTIVSIVHQSASAVAASAVLAV